MGPKIFEMKSLPCKILVNIEILNRPATSGEVQLYQAENSSVLVGHSPSSIDHDHPCGQPGAVRSVTIEATSPNHVVPDMMSHAETSAGNVGALVPSKDPVWVAACGSRCLLTQHDPVLESALTELPVNNGSVDREKHEFGTLAQGPLQVTAKKSIDEFEAV